MRIVILIPGLTGGGAEFVAKNWGVWLKQHGHEVTFVVTQPSGDEGTGLPVVSVAAGSARKSLQAFRTFLLRERPDVVLSLMPYWNLLNIATSRTLPASRRPAVVISGRNVQAPLLSVHGRSYAVKMALSRLVYRRADAFVAISHPVGVEAIAHYGVPQEKVFVVPNPALAKFHAAGGGHTASDDAGPAADAASAAVGGRHIDLVVPARIVPQKRPLLPVRAAAVLAGQGVTTTVHYFGTGKLEADVRAEAEKLGVTAVLHGWVDRWFDHLPARPVVLLASLTEGFGNVLLEAAAAGVPSVISSRCFGSIDAVIPGVTGTVALGDSAQDYALAVDEASRLEMKVPDAWLARFDMDSSGTILERTLTEAVAGREGRG